MTLLEKYIQLKYKIDKVWWYYWNDNRTSLKREKSGILWGKIYNVIYKLKN